MTRLQVLLPRTAAIPLAIMANAMLAASAGAHVKWFCAYNVAGQPAGLENVLCPDFEALTGLSVLALMTGCLIEGTPLGAAMTPRHRPRDPIRARQHGNDVPGRRRPSSSSPSGASAVSC